MKEKDYLAEMDRLIADATAGSGWVAGVIAAKLYAELAEKDPDLLSGWLDAMAVDTLRRVIQSRETSRRTRERLRARRGEFAEAARRYETGLDEDGTRLRGMFAVLHVVSPEDIRKRAGEMTGADHRFVADNYQSRGERSLMHAAFHRAVAEKVGERRTDEVFSVAEYARLYRSIAGEIREPEG